MPALLRRGEGGVVARADVEEFFRRLAAAEEVLGALGDHELDAALDPTTAEPILLAHAQQALLRSEQRHRDLVERCPSLVLELAPDGRVLFANLAARRVLARRLEDLAEHRWPATLVPVEWQDAGERLAAELATRDVTGRELPLTTRDGALRWVEWTSANRWAADGALETAVLFGLDVTERRRVADAERRLNQEHAARMAAEAANRAKSEFLAMMSHELRTPLNAIQGHVQLIEMELHGPVTEAQRTALGRIDGAQRHLLGLITDVLNYAKLEAGRVRYDVGAVRLGDVMREACQLVEPQVRARAHALVLVPPTDEVDVWADREKLVQVLLNLLSNAVKFTPVGGRIEVDTPVRADGTTPADVVYLRVRDSGPGIPRDKLTTVFEPFLQLDARLTRPHEGTGLGLAISRDLAQGMGGALRARCADDAGAAFTLTLPRVVGGAGERVDRRRRTERRAEERRQTVRRGDGPAPEEPTTAG